MLRKCLSFQSSYVYSEILQGHTYIPDVNLCRESYNDIDKVWCFDVTDKVVDSELMECFRCEMSLDQSNGLSGFYCFDLSIDDSRLS